MAGDRDGVDQIMVGAKGPAGDVISRLAKAFAAMARAEWDAGLAWFGEALPDQARIGGSNAQRDMIAYGYAACLAQSGRRDEARRYLGLARPNLDADHAVAALTA